MPGPLSNARASTDLDELLRARLARNLARFERRPSTRRDLRAAAVAIVVTDDERGRPCFLLTRRPMKLDRHAGQWALPGGRADAGETLEAAALRELDEELGLALDASLVLGALDDYETRSGFAITPIVVWGGAGRPVTPDAREVAEVHRVEIAELEKPDVPRLDLIPQSDRPVIVLPIIGREINAPTAAVLYQFVEVAVRGKSTRVAHYEQPVFAWK